MLEGAAYAGLEPGNLQCVRTGHEHDLPGFAIVAALRALPDKVCVVALLDFVVATVEGEFELVHVRKSGGRRDLRHGAMKRCVPARVISGMTRATGVRRDVTCDLRLNRPIVRLRSFTAKIAE